MKLLGQELSKRELVLLGVTVAVAVGSGVFWLSRSIGASATSPSKTKSRIQSTASRLERSLGELERLRRDLGLGKFKLPSTDESPQVHLHIQSTARDCGLAFSTFTATAPRREGKSFQTVTFRFKVTSDLKSLVKFVDRIQSGEYLICLESWSMKPTDDPKTIETDLSLRAYFRPGRRKRRR